MKPTVQIWLYFYTWQRLMKWFVGIGALLFSTGLGLLLIQEPYPVLSRALLVTGAGFALLIPTLATPAAAAQLMDSPRLSLAPRFRWTVGLGMLIQTTVMSLSIACAAAVQGNSPIGIGLGAFIGFSGYVIAMFWFMHSRFLPFYITLAIFGCVILIRFVPTLAEQSWLTQTWLVVISAVVLTGWLVLIRSWQANTWFNNRLPDHYSIAMGWMNKLIAPFAPSEPLGLVLGYPTNNKERLQLAFASIVGAPVITAILTLVALLLVGRLAEKHPELNTWWSLHFVGGTLLVISLINGWLAASTHGLMQRTRLLWLKQNLGRHEFWQKVEALLLKNLVAYWLMAIAICLGVAASEIAQPYLLIYFIAMVAGCLLSAYVSMASALQVYPITSGLAAAALAGLFAWSLIAEHETITWTSLLIATLMALVLRQACKAKFAHLDWTTLKPTATNLQKLTTVKLW